MRGIRFSKRALSFETIFGHDLSRDSGMSTVVTTESARRSMAVWACQSLISGDLANLPFQPFRKVGDVRVPLEDAPSWLDEPNPLNPNYTDISYKRQVTLSLLQDGNAFIAVSPDVGDPLQLLVLNPSQVAVRNGDGMPVYEVTSSDGLSTLARLSPMELIHIPFILPPGATRGLNPIEAAKAGITIDLAAQQQGVKFLDGGGLVTGVIEIPAGQPDLTQVQIDNLRDTFRRRREGPKGYSIGVLQGGAAFKPITMSQSDAQYLETRKFELEEIARLYLVPPFMVGSQEPSGIAYASSVERAQHYIDHCLIHYAGPIEKGHRRLLPGRDTYVKFNFNGLLRGNTKERYEAYAVGLQNKFLYQEDVARLEEMDPNRGGTYLETPNNNGPREAAPAPRASDVHLNVQPAGVSIPVNVEPAAATVEVVNHVAPSEARVEVPVTVQPSEARVEVPVTIAPADVTVTVPEQRTVTKTVNRDAAGRIVNITETPDGE